VSGPRWAMRDRAACGVRVRTGWARGEGERKEVGLMGFLGRSGFWRGFLAGSGFGFASPF